MSEEQIVTAEERRCPRCGWRLRCTFKGDPIVQFIDGERVESRGLTMWRCTNLNCENSLPVCRSITYSDGKGGFVTENLSNIEEVNDD